jgi:hypothetical protein
MAFAAVSHVGPWSGYDLAVLPDDGQRYELFEGTLLVNLHRAAGIDLDAAGLVCEIVSPASLTLDRVSKPALLAEGRLGSHWRIELDPEPAAFAHRLEDDRYVECGRVLPRETLVVEDPFPISLDTSSLWP